MPIKMVKKNKEKEDEEMTIEEINEQQDKELEKTLSNTDRFLKLTYESVNYIFMFTYKTIKFIVKISGIYLLWILLHYFASHLYVKLCVPSTFFGFIMSPFMTATPHCQGLRWIVYNAANMINNMWIVFGAWICSTILIINRDNTPDNRS
jgi:hypothetical protein